MRTTPVRRIAALALLGFAAGCQDVGAPARVEAPVDSAAGEVPFELAGQGGAALLVPAYINGQGPFDLVLDTGATLTCLDEQIIDQLELPEVRGVLGVGAGAASSGRMTIVQLDSLRIGAATAADLTACALDLQHTSQVGLEIDGLLGLNFLSEFRVTLDFERQILHLQAAD